MYRNPKRTRQEVKIFFFFLVDGLILAATFAIGSTITDLFNLSPSMEILSYIFFICLGIWLCIRPNSHPVDRNLFMIAHLIRSDKNRYHCIYTNHNKSLTSKGEK